MTSDIVNLNKFRKSKAREEDKKRAEANRAKFGQTGAQKRKAADDETRRNALLDGAKRQADNPPGDEGGGGKPTPGPGRRR